MILSVLVGLAALAGMVLFIIILISPTKTTFMNKWACNNNLGGGNCVRSSDGYNTESDCMDQCFPCIERKSVESCGLPGDCNWRQMSESLGICTPAPPPFVPGYGPNPIPVGPFPPSPSTHLSK